MAVQPGRKRSVEIVSHRFGFSTDTADADCEKGISGVTRGHRRQAWLHAGGVELFVALSPRFAHWRGVAWARLGDDDR